MSGTAGPRGRYREQVRVEIKALAWAQIATTGATGLSLNAIAKQMGMSGPALYRYYAGRDELITELVLDAYRDLAATVASTSATAGGATPPERVHALARAMRAWALADPHRYLLLYGTPVPGYHAPAEATAVAVEIVSCLLDALAELPAGPGPDAAAVALEAHLADRRAWAGGHPASSTALRRVLTLWTRVHGVLGLELAGHFTGMGFDPALLFDAEISALLADTAPSP